MLACNVMLFVCVPRGDAVRSISENDHDVLVINEHSSDFVFGSFDFLFRHGY